MKLATRMTVALGASALLLFGGGGLVYVRAEERSLRASAVREATLLANSLQSAFENALRDRQLQDVAGTLDALSHVDPSVSIFVFDDTGNLVRASAGANVTADTLRVETAARAQAQPIVEFASESSTSRLRLGLRLRDETPSSPSAIVLEKPLTELDGELLAMRRTIALTALAFVFAVAALSWAIARTYVGQPLARLVEHMRRVREGDLGVERPDAMGDEVGATRLEFQELVDALAAARERADQEFDARRRLEAGLQDADKLITLGQLSAVMAHEIGSPLQVLEGRARALLKHAHDKESTTRTAELLVEQTARIARIVDQMLSITRRRAPVRARIDAASPIRSVVALVEIEARRRRVAIDVVLRGATDAFADPDQLQQVALNLIRNALDATPPGSRILVELGGDESFFELRVTDSGGGVPESIRARLFDPFFTTKTERGGHGLGLLVVRSIVREHEGTVVFERFDPPGCIVGVRIPRDAQQEVA
jgi:signal transduction histidine kinase